jgi:hypothetical protein
MANDLAARRREMPVLAELGNAERQDREPNQEPDDTDIGQDLLHLRTHRLRL